jgi:hypothetical protein
MVAGAFLDWHPLFWISFGAGICLIIAQLRALRSDADTQFLAAWITIFFGAALVLFFAGSARYLLPISAPVAILVSRRLSSKWLLSGAAAQLAIGLALAGVNYQHWEAYREFAKTLAPEITQKRVWTNAEWGFRHYLESYGALPLARGQSVQPGELVVTSELAPSINFTTAGGTLVADGSAEARSSLPLRLIGLASKSAYSTAQAGLRPFDITRAPIDRMRVETVVERKPTLSYLPMNAPEANSQIASGVYGLDSEKDTWRWMGQRAVVLLKPPEAPAPVRAAFHIPEMATARKATLSVDGKQVAEQTYRGPGSFTLASSEPVPASGDVATVTLTIDKTFSVPGDQRVLGVILTEIGFR